MAIAPSLTNVSWNVNEPSFVTAVFRLGFFYIHNSLLPLREKVAGGRMRGKERIKSLLALDAG